MGNPQWRHSRSHLGSVIQYVRTTRGKVTTQKVKDGREPYGLCVLVFLHPAGRTHRGHLTPVKGSTILIQPKESPAHVAPTPNLRFLNLPHLSSAPHSGLLAYHNAWACLSMPHMDVAELVTRFSVPNGPESPNFEAAPRSRRRARGRAAPRTLCKKARA